MFCATYRGKKNENSSHSLPPSQDTLDPFLIKNKTKYKKMRQKEKILGEGKKKTQLNIIFANLNIQG